MYVNDLISPQASARGGYIPNIIFYGGDVRGATGTAICDDDGDICDDRERLKQSVNDNDLSWMVTILILWRW